MSSLLALIVIAVILFALPFLTKRRFGLLGLALCGGALLSGAWTTSLTPFIEQHGVMLISPPLSAIVAILLTMLPVLVLLMGSPSSTTLVIRTIGSLMFALMGLIFLLEPLRTALVFDSTATRIYYDLSEWSSTILTVGIGLALIDLLLTRSKKAGKNKSEH